MLLVLKPEAINLTVNKKARVKVSLSNLLLFITRLTLIAKDTEKKDESGRAEIGKCVLLESKGRIYHNELTLEVTELDDCSSRTYRVQYVVYLACAKKKRERRRADTKTKWRLKGLTQLIEPELQSTFYSRALKLPQSHSKVPVWQTVGSLR